MLDWKINQQVFNLIGTKTDVIGVHISHDNVKHIEGDQVSAIQEQFQDLVNIFIPAKSYCVALVYAHELARDYGGTVVDYLSDSELLLNDKYFVPYTVDPTTYNYFIKNTEWQSTPMAVKIKDYYRKEIHLEGIDDHRD